MSVTLAHMKELAINKTALLALDDAKLTHYRDYAVALIISSGYTEPLDDDHTNSEAGHLALVEVADYLLSLAGTDATIEEGTIKKESLGSWSVEYAVGDEAVKNTTTVLPPIAIALLSAYKTDKAVETLLPAGKIVTPKRIERI